MKASFQPAACEDILRQYRYYVVEKDFALIGQRFPDAVQAGVETLCRTPELGAQKHLENPLLEGLRSWPISGFPSMRIYYIYTEKNLRIVRVLHGKRDINLLLEEQGDEREQLTNDRIK